MERADIPTTQESSHARVTKEDYAHPLSLISRVLFTWNSFHKASQPSFLSSSVQLCVEKRPELWSSYWILHHNNAPAIEALTVEKFLSQKSITEMEQPLYSPNFDLNDLCLFAKIMSALKWCTFQDTEDIKKVMTALKTIPQWELLQGTTFTCNVAGAPTMPVTSPSNSLPTYIILTALEVEINNQPSNRGISVMISVRFHPMSSMR
jgi:hypothetical protein